MSEPDLDDYVRARLARVVAAAPSHPQPPDPGRTPGESAQRAASDQPPPRRPAAPRRVRASPDDPGEIPLPEPSEDDPTPLRPTRPAAAARPSEPVLTDDDPVLTEGEPRAIPGAETALRVGQFVRAHLLVVGLIAALAVLGTGYAVLRAQPVPLTLPAQAQTPSGQASAQPPSAPGSAATTASSGAATPTGVETPAVGIVVHVLGAVRRPGVVELPTGSRVIDAIEAAGGFRRDAQPGDLNLAQILADGQQVVVGTKDDPDGGVRGSPGAGPPSGSASSSGAGGSDPAAPIDLNTATPAQLETLPGVGPVTAAAIVAWRDEHGRFSRVEELQEVDGIGPKTYAQIAPHVRV